MELSTQRGKGIPTIFALHPALSMSFEKIISVPGLSGLFKMVAQMRNGGFIVESLLDARRIPVSSTQRIIMLKDIAVYTMEDEMPLYLVFKRMKEQDGFASGVSPKSEPADLLSAMKKILPEFDQERVHASDIRKMFTWYNLVKELIGSEESEKAMQELLGEAGVEAAEVVAEEPVKKPAARKKKAETEGEAEGAEPKKARKTTAKAKA